MNLKTFLKKLPGAVWIACVYYSMRQHRQMFGRWPNWVFPATFNEWLSHKKLFDRRPILTALADKYEARQFVRDRVGESFLIPLYLVTDNPEDIDFSKLPDRFVIKATHGSGWNVIVKDKSKADEAEVRKQCGEWLGLNFYTRGREWGYKNITPRIIVEKFLGDEGGKSPRDYKFFCFNGVVRFIQVDVDRFENHTRNLYDTSWQQLDVRYSYENCDSAVPAPANLSQMIQTAEKLAEGLDFVRVDLYSVDDQTYFGEMTHYPENGMGKFYPQEFDALFGKYWCTGKRAIWNWRRHAIRDESFAPSSISGALVSDKTKEEG